MLSLAVTTNSICGIDIDDLLVGLVLEDQGMLEKYLSSKLGEAGHLANKARRAHQPFPKQSSFFYLK
jgi:hypothetical protein